MQGCEWDLEWNKKILVSNWENYRTSSVQYNLSHLLTLSIIMLFFYAHLHILPVIMTCGTAGLWSRLWRLYILQAAPNLYSALIQVKQSVACKCRVQVCTENVFLKHWIPAWILEGLKSLLKFFFCFFFWLCLTLASIRMDSPVLKKKIKKWIKC